MNLRWKLHDTDGVLPDWVLSYNPSDMDAPDIEEPITVQVGMHGGDRDMATPPQPMNWTFSGVVYTLAELKLFDVWMDNGRPILLTDHFGQQYLIQLVSVDATRASTNSRPERHKYVAHTLMLERVVA